MDKKVSIITPCYNGEKYISRYLDSILRQTYSNVELIIVNDGSNDNTEKVIKSYYPKFQEKCIELIYLYQENRGQAAALNNGLKYFTGKYITWPDSDDILSDDSIEKKVRFLERNSEFGFVRTDANVVIEENLDIVVGKFSDGKEIIGNEKIFNDLILENNVWFAPGCYMVCSTAFKDVNPKIEIYISNGGQNWQMLLPVAYKYKCGYINEPLYTYVVRRTSHSHSVEGLKNELKRCDEHKDILINTLKSIDMDESEINKYYKLIEEKYAKKKFYLSIQHHNREQIKKYYRELQRNGMIDTKIKINYLRRFYIINISYRVLSKVKRSLGL